MKKILSLLTTAAILLSLSSCKNNIPEEPSLATNTGTSMFNQIMETEDGYYYNSTILDELSLRYYDKATGNSLYLCAKPECTHDGNAFCTATGSGFTTCYTAMYDDNIYIAVTETKEERTSYKLLRASVDGTELTDVCTFMNINDSSESPTIILNDESSMVIHRGKAFVPYFISTSERGMEGRTGAAVIDIQSGKYELITELDMSLTMGPTNVTADGDYFYYIVSYYKKHAENEIWRYNFITDEEEQLTLKESLYDYVAESGYDYISADFLSGLLNYTPIDGKIWYIHSNFDISRTEMFAYNPGDNTTVKMEQFHEKFMETKEFTHADGEISYYVSNYADPKIRYDGEYLYIAEHGFYGSVYNEWDMKLHIFTLDGEELGSFVYDREGACQINIVNKTVYIQTAEGVKYCAVEDIINDNTEWKNLYKFTEHVINEIDW